MQIAAFTAGAVMLIATATLAAAALRLRGSAFVLAGYVLAWAELVLVTEVLSLFDAVGRVGYLVAGAALLACAGLVARRRGVTLPRPSRPAVPLAVAARPELILLAAVMLVAVAYQAFLVVATPPNNFDSLTYHLTRAVAWLQQGHVGYFDATTARANAFPPNGEIGILATLAFLGSDRLAALPQLLAELAVLVAVYGLARRVGFARGASLFAALLTGTLSEFALESVTTQNDLIVASFVAAAVFFVVDGRPRLLPLAATAGALAIGTKLTGLLALPILACAALALLPRRRVAALAVYAALAFVVLGAFTYVENVVRTGHVLGDVPEADPYRAQLSAGGTASTVARVYWRFVDFSGLDPPVGLTDGLATMGSRAFAAAGVAANPRGATVGYFSFAPGIASSEDTSYFGVLGFLLVVPLSFGVLAAWAARRVPRPWAVLAAALPLFVLAVALTQRYDSWLGRFMLIPVALTMPLAAWLYQRRLLAVVAIGLGTAGLLVTHLHNFAKPVGLDGREAIWQMPRSMAQGSLAGSLTRSLAAVDRRVPADARLGVVLGTNDPAYLLYGPTLKRRLVPLPPRTAVRDATNRRLRWVVIHGSDTLTQPGWCRERLSGDWELLSSRAPERNPSTDQRRSLFDSMSAARRAGSCRSVSMRTPETDKGSSEAGSVTYRVDSRRLRSVAPWLRR
jgi:hypothetical protein